MSPSMPGAAPALNLVQGGGKAMPPTAAVATLPGAAPASAVPGAPVPAFASDLAKLLSAAVPAEAATLIAPLELELAEDPDEALPTDALSALWIELGIAAPVAHPAPLRLPSGAAQSPAPASALARAASAGLTAAQGGGAPDTMPGLALGMAPGMTPGTPPGLTLAAALTPDAAVFAAPDGHPGGNEITSSATPGPAVSTLAMPEFARALSSALPPAVVDLRQPQAPQQIAETVVWNVGKGISEVQIRLNPENLGPIEVQLKLDGDKVAVRFDMADASVRDVVQTSLPNLASLLAARGLQLDQAQVFQQDRGHSQSQPEFTAESGGERRGDGDSADSEPSSALRVTTRRGLVDDYV